jgi:hypothetical protein
LDLSQLFFEPSEGQTQQVTAGFAASADWTLQIQDSNSNTVRTVTGSGDSMLFNWDGTGTGGTNIPDGIYSYYVSAQTNGQLSSSSLMTFGLSATMSLADAPTELWAMPSDGSGSAEPLAMYPLGVDTNSLTIFEASWSDMMPQKASLLSTMTLDSGSPDGAAPAYSGASSQSTRGPKRKPRVGVKNKSGTFGVCYKTYPNGFLMREPRTGLIAPLQTHVAIYPYPAFNNFISWGSLNSHRTIANGFAQGMLIGGFKQKFLLADEKWSPTDVMKSSLSGNSIFNTCNLGLLLTHGCRATTTEVDGVKYTYLALYDQTNGSAYVRLSDMDFGSPGVDGLRWMTIVACDMLYPANITSMANNSKLPDNDDLHLLLGASTTEYPARMLGIYYASNLVSDVTVWGSFATAGQAALSEAYAKSGASTIMTNYVNFRVMGYDSCIGDTIHLYNDPDPNTAYDITDQRVFTP